jgi:hypothetical protein
MSDDIDEENEGNISEVGKRKRTPMQRAADALLIEKMLIEGYASHEIADEIARQRPYRITSNQVRNDSKKIRERWKEEAAQYRESSINQELRGLRRQEIEAWTAWEKSKQDGSRQTLTKLSDGTAQGAAKERKSAVKISANGDPAYQRLILEIRRERAKLLGLDAPVRSELTGAGGGPIEVETVDMKIDLTEEESRELLKRTYERTFSKQLAITAPSHGAGAEGNDSAGQVASNPEASDSASTQAPE